MIELVHKGDFMKNYLDDVHEAITKKLNKRFPNSTLEHARVLVKEIINHADKNVYLLSSTFNQEFYESIRPQVVDFLNKKESNFYLIVTSDGNGLIRQLQDQHANFHVYRIDKNILPQDEDSQEYINYIVNDKNAFRYEYSDKDIDKGIVEAIANFNSAEETDLLIQFFNDLRQKTELQKKAS